MSLMSESLRPARSSAVHALSVAMSAIVRSLEAFERIVEAELDRRRTGALLGYADFELRDMGVTRGDVYSALMAAPGEKPSERLSRERAERRRAHGMQVAESRHELDHPDHHRI